MMNQVSAIFCKATANSRPWYQDGDRTRRGNSSLGQSSSILLILIGVLAASPSTTYGQVDRPTLDPVSGHSQSIAEIIPADVLARVELLRGELELVRFEMGAPKEQSPEIVATNVVPREVIYQAFNLSQKASRLIAEITGASEQAQQSILPLDIRPFHVWTVVNEAYRAVLSVKQELGINQHVEEILQDQSVTPSDVFLAIVEANQQFDTLYRKRLSAADTYEQVLVATKITTQLLVEFPGPAQSPNMPAAEHGKRPLDVYFLLINNYAMMHAILERSGIEVLSLRTPIFDPQSGDCGEIRPSDVYDLTVLLVSELAYLRSKLQDAVPAIQEASDPRFKVPSDVYQQGQVLLRQLTELETRVRENPDWLTR